MEELKYMKYAAVLNGYKEVMVEKLVEKHSKSIRKSNLTTLFSQTQREEKRRVRIQYAPSITNRLKKVFKRHNMELVFSSTNKLKNKLGSTKDKTNEEEKSGIYQISCKECGQIYIGQTRRSIKTRFKEHINLRTAVKSAVGEHIMNTNHKIDKENLKLIKNVTNTNELDAYESLFMQQNTDRLMNTMEAPIWSTLFNFGVT